MDTFASFYGLNSNSFYGNVGRSIDVDFLRRFEPFEKEDNIDEVKKKKIDLLNRHEEMNLEHFRAKRDALVSKHNQFIESLLYKNKSRQHILLKKIFENFQKEMESLQEQYDVQLKIIVESHMNEPEPFNNA